MLTKSLDITKLELKTDGPDGDQGLFIGFASIYNVTDRTGDMVMPGAFTKSLSEEGARVPLLWQHDQRSPIGVAELTDTEVGLKVVGQLVLGDPTGAKAWGLMKADVIKKLSIGYDTITAAFEGGVRQLKELKLWEVSLVTIPANPLASVVGMKAMQVLGQIDGVKAGQDGAVDALFDGIAELGGHLVAEKKAGRVLSERNRTLVKAAFEALSALIAAAESAERKEDEIAQVDEAGAKALRSLAADMAAFAQRAR